MEKEKTTCNRVVQHPISVKIEDNQLIIGGQEYFHITDLEVFTGNDHYQETDTYGVKPDRLNRGKLTVSQRVRNGAVNHRRRIRYEPGVRIFLESEQNPFEAFCLEIVHHKGQIMCELLDVKYLTDAEIGIED